MSQKSRGGSSSIWRLSAGATSRITDGLLSSSGAVAAVGLATAVLTLVFAIWFGFELRYQSNVGAPLARSAAALNASINQSLAALRGWIAFGHEASREERGRVWREQIEPTLVELDRLAGQARDAETLGAVAELRDILKRLKIVQWSIEDVAQTPGNQPAQVAYERLLRPLRSTVLRSVHAAIEQYDALPGGGSNADAVADLARFRSAFSEADLAIATYIDHFSEAEERSVKSALQDADQRIEAMRADLRSAPSSDLRDVLRFAFDEYRAYQLQVQEIVALRRSAEWNVAKFLFSQDALPLVVRARALSGALAETQARAMHERTRVLTRSSYAVIAMALLMGLLSAGSLLVSYRLKRQVHNVLQRAKTLGQYELQKRVGSGGMGEVYLGQHAMLRRPTAIKLLRADSAQDIRAQSRFQREVQLTCQLTHPNTIEIFDYGRTPEGIFYYAMEFVDGFTLESLVALAGPVDPSRVVHILVQACGSLQEAHERGLLHRDIKPSNIMLTHCGGVYDTVKLLDFGLVMDLEEGDAGDVSEHDLIAGTPMYLAPESILSADSVSPRSDLYALGAVGYFLLTGTTVFEAGDVTEILSRQISEAIPFPSQRIGRALPEDLEYVVMACLAKDPADRPASAARLAELLLACDCPRWSAEDARIWWAEYGESARSQAADGGIDSALGSGLEVQVDSSRL